jgi:hypothetical protein
MNAEPPKDEFREAIERAVQRPMPGIRSPRIFRLKTLELLDAVVRRRSLPVEVTDDPPLE